MTEKDLERGVAAADEEDDEETEDDKRRREEEENKKRKERQEFMELIHVFIAFGIILGMAAAVVVLDNVLFPDTHVVTFEPLPQQVNLEEQYHVSRWFFEIFIQL